MYEVRSLIDDMQNNQARFLRKIGFNDGDFSLDMEKLVVGGHSFGGMTAI